ncbi:MAG: 50S ribosomal protein L13 [Planctomycetota bacterium]
MKTYMAKKETVQRNWHLMDAAGVPLGRLAVTAATVLMGKHRPEYTPHVDTGDFVVVVNASKVLLTGKKRQNKVYRSHTGYLGHLKERKFEDLMAKRPEAVIELAVRRMLPKTKLGRAMFKKLKVFPGPEHSHGAQQPQAWQAGYGRGVRAARGEDG